MFPSLTKLFTHSFGEQRTFCFLHGSNGARCPFGFCPHQTHNSPMPSRSKQTTSTTNTTPPYYCLHSAFDFRRALVAAGYFFLVTAKAENVQKATAKHLPGFWATLSWQSFWNEWINVFSPFLFPWADWPFKLRVMSCYKRWIKCTDDQNPLTLVNEVKACINTESDLKAARRGITASTWCTYPDLYLCARKWCQRLRWR